MSTETIALGLPPVPRERRSRAGDVGKRLGEETAGNP